MNIYVRDVIDYWHKWQVAAGYALEAEEVEKGSAYVRLAEAAAIMARVFQVREDQ